MDKILVIGSNSFSGAQFVASLLELGHEVIGVSRSPEPDPVFLPYRWTGRDAAFTFHRIDINHDLDALIDLMKGRRTGLVVNFAAQSMVGESWKFPDQWMMTNVVSTVRLHERLRHLDFLDRYLHVTTPEVYGSTDGFITEDAPFRPNTPYAVSRAAADMSLRTFFETYDFPVLFTRAANVYGPGQPLYRIIPRTTFFLLTGRRLQLHGGGVSRRSFIHMKDVADATWRILRQGRPGDSYHISTDRIVSIRELVACLCEKLGIAFDDAVEVAEERPGKDAAYQLDSGKLRRELGWTERISLDAGLDDCIAWVKGNLEVLGRQPLDYVHKP